MAKSNIVIRQKRLPHNQITHEQNVDASSEGKARRAEAEKLQGKIQGSLSDIVREHGVVSDEHAAEWEASLEDRFGGRRQRSRRNSGGWKRYVVRDGKLVPTFTEE